MCLAAVGLLMFAFEGVFVDGDTGSSGSLNSETYNPFLGNALGIGSALGFSVYAVALTVIPKHRKEDGMYGVVMSMWGAVSVIVGGMIGMGGRAVFDDQVAGQPNATGNATTGSVVVSHYARMNPFDMPSINVWLSAGHAVFIFVGFVLYTLGSSHLPAPETVLLSMMEVVGGVLLTYLVVGEYPGTMGMIGTMLTTLAVIVNGVGNGVLEKRRTSGRGVEKKEAEKKDVEVTVKEEEEEEEEEEVLEVELN
jgi:drug/metabolite transporter (DMT)-like permease